MPIYNSYTGIWLLPIHALTVTLEHTTTAYNTVVTTRELTFVHAEANSALDISATSVADFNTGGERIVAFTGDITFVAPYNDLSAMEIDLDAIVRGRVTQMALTLKAQEAQPKGAQMTLEGNVWQPINDWTIKPHIVQLEMRPALELLLHGTMSSAMFALVDGLGHRASFFGPMTEL